MGKEQGRLRGDFSPESDGELEKIQVGRYLRKQYMQTTEDKRGATRYVFLSRLLARACLEPFIAALIVWAAFFFIIFSIGFYYSLKKVV